MVMLVGVMFVWTVAYIAQRNMEGDEAENSIVYSLRSL